MAITNQQRVGQALEYLQEGLHPFVGRELDRVYGDPATKVARRFVADGGLPPDQNPQDWDTATLLRVLGESWEEVFRPVLGRADRSLVGEPGDLRDRWARQENFCGDDTYHARFHPPLAHRRVRPPGSRGRKAEARTAPGPLRRTIPLPAPTGRCQPAGLPLGKSAW